ncbi:MAG: acetyl-CoA carboxylase biotin carboxyl carrier protein [Bradyrhizobium sp.]|nr:MAG: acetyl-CoA carboxylase biotin carboxyl carrier protein [Bradyrhizobium sp.]
MRYDEVAEILKIIDSSSCDELIVETGDMKLVVRRNAAPNYIAPVAERAVPAAPAAVVPQPVRAGQPATVRKTSGQMEVTAPMVGTFYRSPSPDAPPFVEIGTVVRPGQPLCIIEVMKLFTTINSEFDGRVTQIGAEVGDLVEYGRTLFVIEPV